MPKPAAIFQALMPTCRQVARLQSDALDAPLSPLKKAGLRLHLLICRWCRRYGRQIRFLRNAHHHCDAVVVAMPKALSENTRARLKKQLRDEGK